MMAKGNRVCVSADEVKDFMQSFPCSNLNGTRLWFEFDTNGDLVDMGPGNTEKQDGAGLLALSQDAQAYLDSRRKRE